MSVRITVLVATLLMWSALLHADHSPDAGNPTAQRLPETATPLHYHLQLRVDPAQPRFSGETRIRIRLDQATRNLHLHARDIAISRVEVADARGRSRNGSHRVLDEHQGLIEIDFGRRLPPQEINLTLAHDAPFGGQLVGLYRTEYEGHWYAISDLQPTDARRIFPGFDEPGFKTPFTVQVDHPGMLKAFANAAPEQVRDIGDGWTRTRFQTSQPLPTYLFALSVGPWDVRDGPTLPANAWRDAPVPVRGLAAIGRSTDLDEVLDETPELMQSLEDYFATGYAYGKLDLLAAPAFGGGGMENPGLIVYIDRWLLRNSATPTSTRRLSFDLHAHELAHQWVGNLVTLAWWDDLWLNEAFATWMASRLMAQLRPQWMPTLDRFESVRVTAFAADSLASARRIRQPIANSGDIQGAFDGLTYTKGAAVLHMLEAWVGDERFRDGVRAFIAAHRHGTATAADLISAVAAKAADGPGFTRAVDSFLNQPGIPLLQTRLQCDRDTASLHWSQQRYRRVGTTASEPAERWSLPLCLRLGHGAESHVQCDLIESESGQLPLARGCPDWYLPNADARGYYRFSQAAEDRRALLAALDQLTETERLVYADAVAAGFESGDVDAVAVLQAMQRLGEADSPELVAALFDAFEWIDVHLADDTSRPLLHAFANALYGSRLQRIGYTPQANDSETTRLLRHRLTALLALRTRDDGTRTALLAAAEAMLVDDDGSRRIDFERIDHDQLRLALQVWLQARGQPAIDTVFAELARNPEPLRRNSLLRALGSSRDPALATAALDRLLADKASFNDLFAVLGATFFDGDRPTSQRWIADNFDALMAIMPPAFQAMMPEANAHGRCSQAEADQLRDFFQPRMVNVAGGDQSLQRALEMISQCIALKQAQTTPALARWLHDRDAAH